ncbi:MAG: hypothetical protein LBS97_03440 [Treponema sp.]|nr:hypothetical protein [Treponema sp.]
MKKKGLFPLVISALIALFVFGGLSAAIVGSIRSGSAQKAQEVSALPSAGEAPLFLQNPLIPPEQPGIPDDYLLYRERSSAWSNKEVDRWFIVPDSNMLRELHEANDKMISDLLRAAP